MCEQWVAIYGTSKGEMECSCKRCCIAKLHAGKARLLIADACFRTRSRTTEVSEDMWCHQLAAAPSSSTSSNSAGCAQESYYVGRARDCSRYFTPRSLTSIPAAGIVCIQVRQELFIRDVGNRGGSGPRICALKKDGKRVG